MSYEIEMKEGQEIIKFCRSRMEERDRIEKALEQSEYWQIGQGAQAIVYCGYFGAEKFAVKKKTKEVENNGGGLLDETNPLFREILAEYKVVLQMLTAKGIELHLVIYYLIRIIVCFAF